MRKVKLGVSGLTVPAVAVGCMRLTSLSQNEAAHFIGTAMDNGANFFDHADIYGGGKCEELFAAACGMSSALRSTMFLQSKCGIRKGYYDFSKAHILSSVDGILRRLKTDYLDVLLLHRPDALMEPEEVAEAFDELKVSGKVRHFGVSNMDPMGIMLLQKHINQPLVANQLQLSLANATMISQTITMNTNLDSAIVRDNGVLNFCRLNDITLQPWSPFQYGRFEGVFLGNPKFEQLNKEIDSLAQKYGISAVTIVIAWFLRHPAAMQPVIGTMNIVRLKDCIAACEVSLTREEWYSLYKAAGNKII